MGTQGIYAPVYIRQITPVMFILPELFYRISSSRDNAHQSV
jgi:hypothetical protein